jgi:hypothetical protein
MIMISENFKIEGTKIKQEISEVLPRKDLVIDLKKINANTAQFIESKIDQRKKLGENKLFKVQF